MQIDPNLAIYEDKDVVREYLQQNYLSKGEQQMFAQHPEAFEGRRILDIGIGAGRTTEALAGFGSEYVGIDYSEAMVEACKKRFAGVRNASFVHDDARGLTAFPDASFDTAVFSFNGIDTVDYEGRISVLDSIARVLKPGGYFMFSFHNANYLPKLYAYHWQKNPMRWVANYRRMQRIRKENGPMDQYSNKEFFFLKDGGEEFRIVICYMRPSSQLKQLEEHGYSVLSLVNSLKGGSLQRENIDEFTGSWIYVLCRKEV